MANPLFAGFDTLAGFLSSKGWQWPGDWFGGVGLSQLLDDTAVVFSADVTSGAKHKVQMWLAYSGELTLAIPGLDIAAIVFPSDMSSSTDRIPFQRVTSTDPFDQPLDFQYENAPGSDDDPIVFVYAEVVLAPTKQLILPDLRFNLRAGSDLLKPTIEGQSFAEIQLRGVVSVDENFDIDFDPFDSFALPPTMLGDSGVVVTANDVKLDLSRTSSPPEVVAAGFDDGFVGIFIGDATLSLPAGMADFLPSTLTLTQTAIGSGGVSGTAKITNEAPTFDETGKTYGGPGAGSLLGVPFYLSSLALTLKKNAFVESAITGEIFLPFFNKRVQVKLGFDGNGGVTVAVTGVVGQQGGGGTDVFTIEVITGIKFHILSLAIEERDGKALFKTHVKIEVDPSLVGVALPSPEINELVVDSDGHVKVDGGWIDLPNHAAVSLFGFTLEVTKIGFGTEDDGQNWIGFSGGLKLVDGLKAGASVKGLRVRWGAGHDATLSLEGVGVELEIPNTLSITGEVSLTPDGEFRGAVKILVSAISFAIDGQFVAGRLPGGKPYFAIFVHGELPAGLPLGSTGLAIYGMAGLYAQNMSPDKKPGEGWYENPDNTPGWYLRGKPGVGELSKWAANDGALGFGAGITLGTFADNGYEFSGRVLLVLVFPGPIIIIEGKANLFKKRAALETDDPNFRALAVIEPGKSVQLDLDARYKYKSDGELLDLHGSAEAFFADAHNWHIILGFKDDPKRRVGGRLFKLFDVSTYFELHPGKLEIGASAGFDRSWSFGSLGVHVGATIEQAATVSWHPNHFTGTLKLQGRAELRAFGHGVGVNAHADITGDVFKPLHLKGDFHVGIDLPWPLPDIGATVTLEWQEQLTSQPPLPLPLQDASVEFLGWQSDVLAAPRSPRWRFQRGTNLFPNFDQGEAEFAHPAGGLPTADNFTFDEALVVPVDTKVGLTFSRPVNDSTNVGSNPAPSVPPEVIGDPLQTKATEGYRVGYTLTSVVLEKLAAVAPSETPGAPLPAGQSGVGWVRVGQVGEAPRDGVAQIFGAWTQAGPPDSPSKADNPADPAAAATVNNAQTKLMINAKSPFEYTAQSSGVWDDWFAGDNPDYPCVPFDPNAKLVATFQEFPKDNGTPLGNGQFQFTDPPFQVFWGDEGKVVSIDPITAPEVPGTLDRALLVAAQPVLLGDNAGDLFLTTSPTKIIPPAGSNEVRIRVGTPTFIQHDPGETYGVYFFEDTTGNLPDGVLTTQTFDAGGVEIPTTSRSIPEGQGFHNGLDIPSGTRLVLTPIEPALVVEVGLFSAASVGEPQETQATVRLFDASGPTASQTVSGPGPALLRLAGTQISSVEIQATEGNFLLETIYFRTPIVAATFSANDPTAGIGLFTEVDGVVTVRGPNLSDIFLGSRYGGEFVIVDLAIPSRQDEIMRHTIDSLARFGAEDEVFEPETNYRLTVTTTRAATSSRPAANKPPSFPQLEATDAFAEKVYFRTAAPPGIGLPDPPDGTATGTADPNVQPPAPATGFEDLSMYVKRTIPAVPPPAGGHLTPARAVYRAYDVNVEFSPETVRMQRIYRLGRRDLGLRLFDATNSALRDDAGHALLPDVHWGESSSPTVSRSASRWIGIVAAASCAPTTTPPAKDFEVLHSEVVSAPAEEVVLAPETLHQARLVPALLHETFAEARAILKADGQGGRLDRWRARNAGGAASSWVVKKETATVPAGEPPAPPVWFVTETSGVESELVYEGALASIDDTGKKDHPSQWTDLRASVQARWSAGLVGLEVRRQDENNLLRLTLDRASGERRLVAVVGGVESSPPLAVHTPPTFPSTASDVVLTIECVADRVTVFQHPAGDPPGDPVFDVTGAPQTVGTVALLSNAATDLRFSEVRVDDLRSDPSTAYRFDFVTSKYTNFTHHLQSYDDQLGAVAAGLGLTSADLTAASAVAVPVPPTAPPGGPTPVGLAAIGDDEKKLFAQLEQKIIGVGPLRAPEKVEILRANQDAGLSAFLIRSPEPLPWERTTLAPSAPASPMSLGVPGDLKLARVTFGSDPIHESVTIVARSAATLVNFTIEWRPLPDPTNNPDPPWAPYFSFSGEPPLRDGTQVQVFSGAPADAPAREPGTVQRFVADDSASAQVLFASPGIELRLLDAGRNVVHQRQFLTDDRFSPLPMSAIRKGDGTSILLFLPVGSAVVSSVRLAFTFTRNFGVLDPEAPVLRQAGSDTAEAVTIDLCPPTA
jgi:hypothetical protein